jgi:hypothetical protein
MKVAGTPALPFLALLIGLLAAGTLHAQGQPPSSADEASIDARPFPREFTVQGTRFSIHQPQVETWEGNRLSGHMVMSVTSGVHAGADGKSQDSLDHGSLDFIARTQVDKGARAVVLTDMEIARANFPTATNKQSAYLALAREQLKKRSTLTISLDQLESALAIAKADAASPSQAVRNDPPDIIFSTTPAVLVIVDGPPALRPTGHAGVQRVINSRSLLLQQDGKFFLYMAGRWASAAALQGPWAPVAKVDSALTEVMKKAVAEKQVETMETPPDALKQVFASGAWPGVHVRTGPAELVSVQGDPVFMPIPGTKLSYIDNTGADVFVDAGNDNAWYVLVSGRWFTATGSKGPWAYVAPAALPADFAKIPADSPKSGALASLPDTPESREALIANSIPQTATVHRSETTLSVPYDGAPQFSAIAGTPLQYAINTPVPVIRVSANRFFAVDKGVWFTTTAATGPWSVATDVPAVIYTIPSSSPLHYVTYVRVYGQNGDEVYVGYTPGYYGTLVTDDVVVYGAGYPCTPWIGTYWYGCPLTYGMGVYFGWNAWVGWTFGWGWGWYDGWYGPYSPWWGPWYGPVYPYGWWGGGAAAWNVYGHWGNAAVRGTAAAWANPWTGNVGRGARGGFYNEATGGRGVGRAGVNTNIYTGTTTAAAQGIRYNPQTGRVVAGGGAVAVNPYTGQAGMAGQRTVVNTDTGRVTQAGGAAGIGPDGAAGVGAINSEGPRGDVKGVGGFHYNADTGTLHRGGVVNVNDNVYAGRDGNVYKYDDGQWSQVTRPDGTRDAGRNTPQTVPENLYRDRAARERGNERMSGRQPSQFNSSRGGMSRPVGGFRSGLGGRGGGFRGR